MAESCPTKSSNQISSINNRDSELPNKQDCASPSPTETVCLDSLCNSENVPGTSQDTLIAPLSEKLDEFLRSQSEENKVSKHTFLGELGLEECEEEEDDDSVDKEDHWEDCTEGDYSEENQDLEEEDADDMLFCEDTPDVSIGAPKIRSFILKQSSDNNQEHDRYWRKRKLDVVQNGFPSKKQPPDTAVFYPKMEQSSRMEQSCSSASSSSSTPVNRDKRSRLVIPTRDNPPPAMSDWLGQFQMWTNAERVMAINELIACCEPTQVRHMMQVIEPQFQRDFISLLPRELALNVLSFLEPKDLLRAAQTCRSWRFLAEDNLLWKEKCREAGIDEIPANKQRRCSPRSPATLNNHANHCNGNSGSAGGQTSPWKAAYMRQHAIEMNWRVRPIRSPKMLKGHDDHVITCLQFCGNRIVSGSDDNTLKVWSALTGKCLRTLCGHTGGVWSSQMSGTIIISGSTDRTLKVWDSETGVCTHTLYGHTSTVRCMHLHGNKVVSGSRDATLRVWDVETGECLHVLVGHLAAVRCVQYDGKLVVSGAYDYMVKVWNPEREECLHTLQGHTNRVYSLQFDGVHVVSGSLDTSIRVWEVETGACKHALMGHQSLTSGMELRNNILVSGNADSTVKVWDIVTGQCLQTLSGSNKHQSAVTCLQFNSRFVITSSDDGTVKLWDVRTGEFIRNLVALDSGGSGGVVWRIRANDTKLVCAVGSRNGTEETKLLVLDFDVDSGNTATNTQQNSTQQNSSQQNSTQQNSTQQNSTQQNSTQQNNTQQNNSQQNNATAPRSRIIPVITR